MDHRPLTKLFNSPMTKLTWSQIQRIQPLKPNEKDLHCSSFNSDASFLKSSTVTNPFLQKPLSNDLNKVCTNGFSTSTNHNFWNKLTAYDQPQFQGPAQLYTQKTEVEPLLVEGVGWAGQPIVRRIHPILPEVYGDVSDIVTAVDKLPSKAIEEAVLFSQAKGVNDPTKLRTHGVPVKPQLQVNLEEKGRSPKNPDFVRDSLVNTDKPKEESEVKDPPRSSDVISLMDENIKSGSGKRIDSKETDYIPLPVTIKGNGRTKRKTEGQSIITEIGLGSKKDKHLKRLKDMDLNSGLVLTKRKKKSKKKTKVCAKTLHHVTKKAIKKSKKSNISMFEDNKKSSFQPNILLSPRAHAQPVRKTVVILANRQFQTYSQANQAKVAVSVKERKTSTAVVALGKKPKKTSTPKSEGKYPEDCKCPEVLDIKTRFSTKICGEAASAVEKKQLRERKGKMCPIEHQVQHRTRTVVCNSAKFAKDKRKRQLPKCVKPEKQVAPRVVICPPVLEEELAKREKKCVKQVEEVKVRSRTTVCRPIIMYQKEEAKIVVQKEVCTEKVKKTISRHTKVCPPSEENISKKKSDR